MNRKKFLSVLFLCFGIGMTANGIWMLVASNSWFTTLPASLEDTGPLNIHFAHDVGLAYLTFGLGMIWCSRHIMQSRVVFLGVTIFTVGHALSHVGEMLYGQLPATHWYIDFPLVFSLALLLGIVALPPVWNYFQKAPEN